MIRKTLRFLRFAAQAERLLLGYKACGLSEEQVLQRWRADLIRLVNDQPAPIDPKRIQEFCRELRRSSTIPQTILTDRRRTRTL